MNDIVHASSRLVLMAIIAGCTMLAVTVLMSSASLQSTTGLYMQNIPDLTFVEKMFLTFYTRFHGKISQFFVFSGVILGAAAFVLHMLGKRKHRLWLVPLGILALSFPIANPQILLTQAMTSFYSPGSYETAFPKRSAGTDSEDTAAEDTVTLAQNIDRSEGLSIAMAQMASTFTGGNMAVSRMIIASRWAISAIVFTVQWATVLAGLLLVIWPIWDTARRFASRSKGSVPAAPQTDL